MRVLRKLLYKARCLLGLLSCLILSTIFIQNTYAFDYGSSAIYLSTASGRVAGGNLVQQGRINNVYNLYVDYTGYLESLTVYPNSSIPANSLSSFTVSLCGLNKYSGMEANGLYRVAEDVTIDKEGCTVVSLTFYNYTAVSSFSFPQQIGWINRGYYITVSPITVTILREPLSATDLRNISNKANNIDGNLSLLNNKVDNVYNLIQEIKGSNVALLEESKKQTAEAQKQTENQEQQYNDEKQEEQQREQQMEQSSSDASSVFNFTIHNPFQPIFDAFTNGQCVAIPNLARMVGSNQTQYCSWFSSSTRSIVTPVISIFSMILLFGFVIKWLNSDTKEGE